MLPLGRFPSATSSCSAIFREIADVTRISSQENAKFHFASFCYLIWRVTKAASPLKAFIGSFIKRSFQIAQRIKFNYEIHFWIDPFWSWKKLHELKIASSREKSQNTRTFTLRSKLQIKISRNAGILFASWCLDFCSHFCNDTRCQRPQLANAMIWHFGNMH